MLYRSELLLPILVPNDTVIFLTMQYAQQVNDILESYGYKKNKNYYYLRDLFYDDCYEERSVTYSGYLDLMFKMDVEKSYLENDKARDDCLFYSSIDDATAELLNQIEFSHNDAMFDFGCGKGLPIMLAYYLGAREVGGVEYDEMLYKACVNNLTKVKIPANNIFCGDAIDIKEQLDAFNIFFFYNPFVGETFEKVIKNIQDSYERRKRKMFLLYGNPVCHQAILKNSNFRLTKKIQTGYVMRLAYIYRM